jgi:hypothetical protein
VLDFFCLLQATSAKKSMLNMALAPKWTPQYDMKAKSVTLRSGTAVHIGALIAGPDGVAMAQFDQAGLNFKTEIPNLLVGLEVKKVVAPKKGKGETKKKPAAVEKKPAAESTLANTIGLAYFSDQDSDSSDEGQEEAEEEVPKEHDTEEEKDEPVVAAASSSSVTVDAATFSEKVGERGRRYTWMHYKNNNRIGIRRGWREEGYVAPRQSFTFGSKDVPHEEKNKQDLIEIAKQVVAKLAEGLSEVDAEKFAKEKLSAYVLTLS